PRFGGRVDILTADQRLDIVCFGLKGPVVDFAEELRLTFGPEELARWQATDTIPNIMGGPDRVRLRYDFYEDCLRQIAYGPAERIPVPTLPVPGQQEDCIFHHPSRGSR